MGCYRERESRTTSVVKSGVGFGSALAMAISYTANMSIGWAIIHGIFGWAYVIYYWLKYADSLF